MIVCQKMLCNYEVCCAARNNWEKSYCARIEFYDIFEVYEELSVSRPNFGLNSINTIYSISWSENCNAQFRCVIVPGNTPDGWMAHHPSGIVHLNVGGVKYSTTSAVWCPSFHLHLPCLRLKPSSFHFRVLFLLLQFKLLFFFSF